jgi:ring-1,2-phenylacetyl-CoA epoxidase subunit PaaC
MNNEALKDLLYRLADDDLMLGHRSSEWTGFGPVLEEDIAFSSMAQDQIGHSLSYFMLLQELGEPEADQNAFMRTETAYRSAHLVEYPVQDYAFSLARHFFYDYAKHIRLKALKQSTYAPLRALADRFTREHKYHLSHARTWMVQLGNGTEESRLRMQSAVNQVYPMALGLFEPTLFDAAIAEAGIQAGTEQVLASQWLDAIEPILAEAQLQLPPVSDDNPYLGGRKGYHSEYLQPLLDEMTVVFRSDPQAAW